MILKSDPISEMRNGEINFETRRSRLMNGSRNNNSRGYFCRWGNVRLEVATWVALSLLFFQLLDQTKLVSGFPLEDEFSEEAAKAVIAAMSSGGISHHNMNLMKGESDVNEEDEMSENTRGESSLPRRLQAVELLLHKAAAEKAEEDLETAPEQDEETDAKVRQETSGRGRALWSESDEYIKRASDLHCRTSATLQCGKRILTLAQGHEKDMSVHMKCDLRDDFLKCIDRERNDCLELAETSILPELPSKEMIKVEQAKLWKVLWTAGGCILAN